MSTPRSAQPTPIRLDPALRERIAHLADARRRSAHWIMREAIEEYVTREEQRQALRKDALNAWEEYQATGMHVTLDEVSTWLRNWGTDDEQAPPACHP